MDIGATRWQYVREKFLEAAQLEDAARAAWLQQLRLESPEVWQELQSLLAAHDHTHAVLDRQASDFLPADTLELPDDRWCGRRVGAYVIIALLGRGGMGEVYRARRADAQYEKEVAIKLVRAGFDTGDILERFRVERQILADLEHPNIARLLDGGTTDEGLPYLVMELIEGERIDLWCDGRRLSVRERLQLFQQVCDAVQFAHQRLVIHRDLKTGNILVTRDGTIKLLDFGVAKLLRAADASTETTLFRPLTPAYASPEQIRGEPLTTASDVYSLGVILFELLTGRSPFPAHARTMAGVAQRAGSLELQRASVAVHTLGHGSRSGEPDAGAGATLEEVAAARSTAPHRLRRLLSGDLDAILQKAMRAEPGRRYGSVQQLTEDVERHLRGAAVMAHRGSWRYRFGKLVMRNKVAAGGLAAALLALTAGLIVSAHQARIAQLQRQRADARFADTRKLANALIFDVNDAMADTPGNTSARKLLLDRAVEYLDKLSQEAAGDTNLQRELGWGYQKLAAVQGNTTQSNVGEISAADRSLHKAIALFEAVHGANPESLEDGLNLAMSHRLMGASDVYYPGGPPEIARAVALLDQLSARHPANSRLEMERCSTYDLLAYSQDIAGERIQSVASAQQALALAQALQKNEPGLAHLGERVAAFTVHLGTEQARTGSLQAAEATLLQGVKRYAALRQADDKAPELARNGAHAQMLLGQVNVLRGHLADADANFRQAAATVDHLLQLDPGNSMLKWDSVSLQFEQGRVLALNGHDQEALARAAPALARYAEPQEDDSGPGIGVLEAWNARLYLHAGRFAEARSALDRSITAIQNDPPYADARDGLAADQVMLGDLLTRQHDYPRARAAYDQVLAQTHPDDALAHGDVSELYTVADAQSGLGDLLMVQATATRNAEARSHYAAEACQRYADSERTWGRVAEPGLFSPDQYPGGSPQAVRTRLSGCVTPPRPPAGD
jgi:non-specific serine/threonine protein kinase/serine/threonine-protein kinase